MMKLLLWGAYVLLGFVQLFAIADYFGGGFFSMMWAFFLTYIPLVGSVFGVLGAHQEWGWELWQALMLFFLVHTRNGSNVSCRLVRGRSIAFWSIYDV